MKRNDQQANTEANFKRAKALIIEDNEDHWALIQRVMHICLPEVGPVWASSAKQVEAQFEIWEHQEWELPKLIILDLYLPTKEDGWQLIEDLKSKASTLQQIPLVVLSGSSDRADIQKAYQQGASSYLIKPLEFDGWLAFFGELRQYWWQTVTLPPLHFTI